MASESEEPPAKAKLFNFTPEQWRAICQNVREIVEANRREQLKRTGGREPETPEENFMASLD